MTRQSSEDPKVQTKMFRTSKLQKIVKVPQVRDIDEVAKVIRRMWVPMIKDETQMVTRSMRRQVPTIRDETERRTRSPGRCRSVSVLTSRAGRTQPKCRQKCRQRTETHEEQSRKAAEEVMPDVQEARV